MYCLQETSSKEDVEKIWSAEWGGQIIFSHGSEHSRGVCILLSAENMDVFLIPFTLIVIAKVNIGDEQLFVINILYAPNKGAE